MLDRLQTRATNDCRFLAARQSAAHRPPRDALQLQHWSPDLRLEHLPVCPSGSIFHASVPQSAAWENLASTVDRTSIVPPHLLAIPDRPEPYIPASPRKRRQSAEAHLQHVHASPEFRKSGS